MFSIEERELSHILYHLGEENKANQGPMIPSIHQSANFNFQNADALEEAFRSEHKSHIYTRGNNPTVEILRKKMAALEGFEDALIFSSGSAAISAAILSQCDASSHVICVQKPYSWTYFLLNDLAKKYGVQTSFVDGTETANFKNAIRDNTRLIFLESPNSLSFELQDLRAVVSLAKENGIKTILDNSFCTPLSQRASDFGIDMVVHSATKYINGHGDVVGGVLCGSLKDVSQIFSSEYMTLGGNISPFDAWLILRGLRTIPQRIRQVSETASYIINKIRSHRFIERIHYPLDPNHPQADLARRQMSMGMGMFTIELKDSNTERIKYFCDQLYLFAMAVSWGGFEALTLPSCILPAKSNVPVNLVRTYVGLQDKESLCDDLLHALYKTYGK